MDQSRPMAHEISCRSWHALIPHVERRLGCDGVDALLKGLVDSPEYLVVDPASPDRLVPVQRAYLEDTSNWVSNAFSLQIFANASRILPGERPLYEAGRACLLSMLPRLTVWVTRMLGPVALAGRMQRLNARFNRTKDVKVTEASEKGIVLQTRYKPGYAVTKNVCDWNRGVYAGGAAAAGGKNARCEELQCVVDGASCCVFQVAWGPLRLQRRVRRALVRRSTRELMAEYELSLQEREEALRQVSAAEQRLRLIAEHSQAGMCILRDGHVVDSNARLAQLMGCSPDELQGQALWGYARAADREWVRARVVLESAYGGGQERVEFSVERPEGQLRRVELLLSDVEWDGRSVKVGNAIDITDRGADEAALRPAQ